MSAADIERQITVVVREMGEFQNLADPAVSGQVSASQFVSSSEIDGFTERGILHLAKLDKLFADLAALAEIDPHQARRLTLRAYHAIGATYAKGT